MKRTFKFFEILLLMCGVFGADEVKSVSVMEGDSVTLNPDLTQIQGIIQILWRFGEPGLTIAQIDENGISYDGKFKDKLQLNQTGSLTIKNMRIKHSGLYKLKIDHNTGTSNQKFSVTVYESPSGIDAGVAERQLMSVKEGKPVTLDVPQIQGDELIVWRFGDEGKLIAKADLEAKSSPLYDEERFRNRLQLNDQTGSLTITNTRTTDSGFYKVKISSNNQILYKRFTVTVSVPDSGYSGGAVAGIVVGVLLAAAVAAGVIYCLLPTNLPNQTLPVQQLDSVKLNPGIEIQRGDVIQWLFKDKDTLIDEIKGENKEKTYEGPDERFMYRLYLDEMTGSLTITDIRTEHDGLYTLKIRRGRETFYQRFYVYVVARMIRVMEGDPVTLHPDPKIQTDDVPLNPDTEIQTDDVIQWLFGYKDALIAEIKGENREKTHEGPDGRFKNRLKLDEMTGSLTITEIRTGHDGLYTLKIRRGRETFYKRFFVSVTERTKRALEGDLVTLNPDPKIQRGDEIQWLFGTKDTLIAEIKGENREKTHEGPDEIFKNRLKLDEMTGSLTITDIRTDHDGLYTLKIRRGRETLYQRFHIYVKKRTKRALEGDLVKLNPETEIQRGDEIQWLFGDKDALIAEIKGENREKTTHEGPDGRFKNRLKLDEMTGSLIITDTTTEHTGLYTLKIRRGRETLYQRFFVSVSVRKVAVILGKSACLYTGLTEIQTDEKIEWRFGDENSLIAEIKGGTGETQIGPDKRFRDRLKLNEKTGDLTISDSRVQHIGHYKLKICSSERNTNMTFIFSVIPRPEPLMKEKNDSKRKQVNESVTVEMENDPLLDGENVNVVNEEGTSSL